MASGDENSSQYESDSDYYSESEQILKPVFVPKNQRITILEQEEKALQEELLAQAKKKQQEEQVTQTRMLVADSIRRTAEQAKDLKAEDVNSDAECPDDTDNLDEEVEFEDWKVREIMRLKRDAEEREAMMIEKADLLRRRNMTDEERLAEDKRDGKVHDEEEERPKWKYMQKYYHKGAFYMDTTSVRNENDVRAKDYSAEPTLEDKIDKEKLPAVLQVKNFGKRGRTKYTHLVDQDTTIDTKLMKRTDFRADRRLMDKYLDKRSGVGKL